MDLQAVFINKIRLRSVNNKTVNQSVKRVTAEQYIHQNSVSQSCFDAFNWNNEHAKHSDPFVSNAFFLYPLKTSEW